MRHAARDTSARRDARHRGWPAAARQHRRTACSASSGRKPDALGDDAEARPRPSRARNQPSAGPSAEVAQQSVEAERREEAQHARRSAPVAPARRTGTSAAARVPPANADFAAAHAPQQVVDEQRRADAREQRRAAGSRCAASRSTAIARGHQPEEQRRLVGVEVAADARDQPVAGAQHVLRDQREARLVGAARDRAGRARCPSAAARVRRASSRSSSDVPPGLARRDAADDRAGSARRRRRPATQVSSRIATRGDARRDQPPHAEQVDDADPQPVVQSVLRRAPGALAVVDRHARPPRSPRAGTAPA